MPTLKLISKTRVGSKIKKVYDTKVISSYQRLLASPDLCGEAKAELTRRFALYDPVMLQLEVHNAVDALLSPKKQPILSVRILLKRCEAGNPGS
jgi:hypothetical protein